MFLPEQVELRACPGSWGKLKAMEIMVTGRKFSFEESREMDLVHDIYDSMSLEEFRQDVLDYSGRFTLPFERIVG